MIHSETYYKIWGGEKADIVVPDYYTFMGFPLEVGDKEAFLRRYGTIEGLQEQYRDIKHKVGLIYHIIPATRDIGKFAHEKTMKELIRDGWYNADGTPKKDDGDVS